MTGMGVNAAAEELARLLPVNENNVRHVMGKVRNVRRLYEMDLVELRGILGAELGKGRRRVEEEVKIKGGTNYEDGRKHIRKKPGTLLQLILNTSDDAIERVIARFA
ncbi:hypothetical protein K435DRAFT_803482 [Dendrothele bispora CBS 962.96]|uniref:Uncharacterized protein n=1 Tax=Dendrothele bispora (strain CBS 962.96) TaxID=1314807 RepID=A0A4S8LHB8_DENBC|nr:hypothetical protein K435DRAFT_803482 [Dendrothele bispora CBS 962.96]